MMRNGNESTTATKKSGNNNRNTAMLSPLHHRPMKNATAIKNRDQMNQTMQSGFTNYKHVTTMAVPMYPRNNNLSPVTQGYD